MLFNSIDFAIFLPIVFAIYWFVVHRNLRIQNLLLVIASYIFYGCWDWRFLFLIFFSTLLDYGVGFGLGKTDNSKRRKWLLWSSILINLGLLGFFKYYNFFVDSFADAFSFFGFAIRPGTLHIILPVGISFYTFQTLSYSIDVYRRKLVPTRNFIAFAAFVSFFPQLVAGPIERSTHLLPQFYRKRTFDYTGAVDGLRQILWGLFKKMVIADNCAIYANQIFDHSASLSGAVLLLGAIFFAFQIYGDFSGYSDIAIGTSKLFGFDLMRNFNYPYFARDVAEFWRRWHISLSTWFRDYLYIPLGGSKGSTWMKIRNTFIIFLVSGFWHGANWTFIIWGALHAVYFLPLLLRGSNRVHLDIVAKGRWLPGLTDLLKMGFTFLLITLAWVFFRAETVGHALQYLSHMGSNPGSLLLASVYQPYLAILSVLLVFVLMEWIGREGPYALAHTGLRWKRPFRHALYYAIILAIYCLAGTQQQFIYFQF